MPLSKSWKPTPMNSTNKKWRLLPKRSLYFSPGFSASISICSTKMKMVKVNGPLEAVSEDQIGEAEEKNYEMLELSAGKKFRDRLDPFFENSDQEDLIAFAEEAVLEDEDDPESLVTKEGREPIFIALKTMVDVLSQV